MARIIVRDLDDDVTDRLKRRAARHGRSMEDEARAILRDAVPVDEPATEGLGTRIARRFAGIGVDLDPIIEELRRIPAVPARFDD